MQILQNVSRTWYVYHQDHLLYQALSNQNTIIVLHYSLATCRKCCGCTFYSLICPLCNKCHITLLVPTNATTWYFYDLYIYSYSNVSGLINSGCDPQCTLTKSSYKSYLTAYFSCIQDPNDTNQTRKSDSVTRFACEKAGLAIDM